MMKQAANIVRKCMSSARGLQKEKKKKGRNTGEKIKSDGGRSSSIGSISMPSNNAGPSRFKKRKLSMEPSQEPKKHNPGPVSRRGSVDTERANHYLPINSPTPYSAPPHLGPDVRPPPFPTLENGTSAHQTYESPEESRARHLMALRRNNYGPPTMGYPVASPQSFPPSSPTLSANSMGGPGVSYSQNTHAASSVQSHRSQSDTRDARSNHGRSSTPQTTSITSPMAMGTPMYKMLDPNSSGVHLPPPAQFDMLVDTYFEHFYSQTYAFLHRPSFVKNLDQKPPILKFSICAVAARFTDDITPEAAEVWADATRTLILRQYDTYTLEVVQSMVHMGIHDFGTNNGQKAWMFAGMAVRMGSALNMNLEPKKKELSIIEREVYRRTYWAYYLMDRFNCYGVARAYLIQDHDCHVQLPCNQPSFERGEEVGTELLDGPHPHHPDVGTQNMGAYAFLVRITCIWSNILRRIHFATLKKDPVDENDTLKGFSSKLDKWRNSLPLGLTYSVKNLAAQVDFGTTGAFVMMHVMWHMAMAYVHRYVRLGGMLDVNDGDNKKMIVTSIRKAFVHADTILQIMREVWVLREATKKGDKPLIVNAPFLGQAIQDACVISAKRAMEVNNSPERYSEQIERLQQGLEWLSELKRYWVPINSQYNRVLKLRKQLDEIRNPRGSIPAPVTEAKPQQNFPQVNPVAWTTPTGMQFDQIGNQQVMGSQSFDPALMMAPDDPSQFAVPPEFLSIPIPPQFYVEAFNHESYQTMETYATYESGFPHLYTPVVTTAYTDPTIPVSAHYHQITPPTIHEHQPFPSQPSRMDDDGSDDDDHLGTPDIVSGTKSDRDIHTTYFDAGAVHDGKLQDSGSDSSGRSRRASDSGGQAVKSMPTNRMDVLNLINTTGMDNRGDDANGMVREENGAATFR
ncbi:hypothetical protein EX30DRAFT_271929 [Ascodesmis nigricans]|uniref:Xylanolytic transcriptional activator regulatory domain-containing protein n=1 Tax=Ascodesmis nigricans TaxID=341454 RepID=A0A4S2MX66_9PEZI|nr:hypothetical protein EX30DRAFT_271929 [Ascodesmis nigricans]